MFVRTDASRERQIGNDICLGCTLCHMQPTTDGQSNNILISREVPDIEAGAATLCKGQLLAESANMSNLAA